MELSEFDLSQKQSVVKLFNSVFSDSDGELEGKLVADLVLNLITTTKPQSYIGFVALIDKKVIGCIFFSVLFLPVDKKAFILSPVAIDTKNQGKGIGQKLINHGIDKLKSNKIDFIFTYGDPKYYSKFGFNQISENIVKPPYKLSQPEGWLALSLFNEPIIPIDNIKCIEALSDQKYW